MLQVEEPTVTCAGLRNGHSGVTDATHITSSEVIGDCDAQMRDRDWNIAPNRAIRRQRPNGRAHKDSSGSRGATAGGMVPQGPEDAAGAQSRRTTASGEAANLQLQSRGGKHSGECRELWGV